VEVDEIEFTIPVLRINETNLTTFRDHTKEVREGHQQSSREGRVGFVTCARMVAEGDHFHSLPGNYQAEKYALLAKISKLQNVDVNEVSLC
jgi:hypothetical protein